MAKVRFDMVAESSTTTGTGTITLGGAKNPGRTFATAGVANGDTFKYRISHDVNNEWEVGTGTMVTSTTFNRSVLFSSNANALVNFSAGNKTVEMVVDAADLNAMEAVASDTTVGDIEIAVQAEMEAGTDTTRAVTPGRQHFHPSAAKCWCISANSTTILASYNMTSITDTGVGDLTFTIGTDFSSTNWVPVCTQRHPVPSSTVCTYTMNAAKAAGTVDLDTFDIEKAVSTAAPRTDASEVGFVGFGDQ